MAHHLPPRNSPTLSSAQLKESLQHREQGSPRKAGRLAFIDSETNKSGEPYTLPFHSPYKSMPKKKNKKKSNARCGTQDLAHERHVPNH